jgi:hypothetical protein
MTCVAPFARADISWRDNPPVGTRLYRVIRPLDRTPLGALTLVSALGPWRKSWVFGYLWLFADTDGYVHGRLPDHARSDVVDGSNGGDL